MHAESRTCGGIRKSEMILVWVFGIAQTDLPFLFVSVLIRGLLCHCCAAADLLPLTAPQPLSQLEAPLIQSCLPPLPLSSLHAESQSHKGRMILLLCVSSRFHIL